MTEVSPIAAGSSATPGRRIVALDIARSAALLAMAVFHFAFDLEMFGWLAPGTVVTGFWRLLAVSTASSFLVLVGIGLWLGHGGGIRWRGFWRRFLKIAAGAAAVSVATYIVFPDAFVFFGILHVIAVASLLGLALLRLPVWALLALAGLLLLAPGYLRAPVFDAPWLWWTGLQTVAIRSVDYLPVAPWLAPVAIGIALGKLGSGAGVWTRAARWKGGAWADTLAWPGRHSLLVYLAHQPVLIALVAGATMLLR